MEPGAYVDTIDDSERWGAPGTIDSNSLRAVFALRAASQAPPSKFLLWSEYVERVRSLD